MSFAKRFFVAFPNCTACCIDIADFRKKRAKDELEQARNLLYRRGSMRKQFCWKILQTSFSIFVLAAA